MKKMFCLLIVAIAFFTMGQNVYSQEKKLWGMDLGLQITTLAEVGFFMAYKPVYFGFGMNLWQPNDFEGDPYWNDEQ
jgi:hypothetical protein